MPAVAGVAVSAPSPSTTRFAGAPPRSKLWEDLRVPIRPNSSRLWHHAPGRSRTHFGLFRRQPPSVLDESRGRDTPSVRCPIPQVEWQPRSSMMLDVVFGIGYAKHGGSDRAGPLRHLSMRPYPAPPSALLSICARNAAPFARFALTIRRWELSKKLLDDAAIVIITGPL